MAITIHHWISSCQLLLIKCIWALNSGDAPEGEENKQDEKPRGNGTMWALFPGGFQVYVSIISLHLLFASYVCLSSLLLVLPLQIKPFLCLLLLLLDPSFPPHHACVQQSPLRPKTAQEFEEQGYRRAHEGVHIMRDKEIFEKKR